MKLRLDAICPGKTQPNEMESQASFSTPGNPAVEK